MTMYGFRQFAANGVVRNGFKEAVKDIAAMGAAAVIGGVATIGANEAVNAITKEPHAKSSRKFKL